MISILSPITIEVSLDRARYIVDGLYLIIKALIKAIGFDEYVVTRSIGSY
jgi:hypothetical protein